MYVVVGMMGCMANRISSQPGGVVLKYHRRHRQHTPLRGTLRAAQMEGPFPALVDMLVAYKGIPDAAYTMVRDRMQPLREPLRGLVRHRSASSVLI